MRSPSLNAGTHDLSVKIVRLTAPTEEAVKILDEYYEAVHVLLRDTPADIQRIIETPASGVWLAYCGDQAVGCVVLRNLLSIPLAGECKRLYVRPAFRGTGMANRMLNLQEEYARKEGLKWLYLDTYGELKPAITLYERRGFVQCERFNDNPQATIFMRKNLWTR